MNNESSQRGVTSLNKLTRIKMSILIVMSMLYLVNKWLIEDGWLLLSVNRLEFIDIVTEVTECKAWLKLVNAGAILHLLLHLQTVNMTR